MDRKRHEPLTLGKHDNLTHEVNEMIIAVKLHHCYPPEREERKEDWEKAKSNYKQPTWEDVIELLTKARDEMNKCRYDPRKY